MEHSPSANPPRSGPGGEEEPVVVDATEGNSTFREPSQPSLTNRNPSSVQEARGKTRAKMSDERLIQSIDNILDEREEPMELSLSSAERKWAGFKEERARKQKTNTENRGEIEVEPLPGPSWAPGSFKFPRKPLKEVDPRTRYIPAGYETEQNRKGEERASRKKKKYNPNRQLTVEDYFSAVTEEDQGWQEEAAALPPIHPILPPPTIEAAGINERSPIKGPENGSKPEPITKPDLAKWRRWAAAEYVKATEGRPQLVQEVVDAYMRPIERQEREETDYTENNIWLTLGYDIHNNKYEDFPHFEGLIWSVRKKMDKRLAIQRNRMEIILSPSQMKKRLEEAVKNEDGCLNGSLDEYLWDEQKKKTFARRERPNVAIEELRRKYLDDLKDRVRREENDTNQAAYRYRLEGSIPSRSRLSHHEIEERRRAEVQRERRDEYRAMKKRYEAWKREEENKNREERRKKEREDEKEYKEKIYPGLIMRC